MTNLLFDGADWSFDTIQRVHDAIEKIAVGEMGLSVYPNQIEVITSEQMLDAPACRSIIRTGLSARVSSRAKAPTGKANQGSPMKS
jgi:spore cortex formation protein SpoVR/YcgB (stage V sporulation)